jgi:hypothetical protein
MKEESKFNYKIISRIIALIVIIVACVVMTGWFLDIQILKSIHTDLSIVDEFLVTYISLDSDHDDHG